MEGEQTSPTSSDSLAQEANMGPPSGLRLDKEHIRDNVLPVTAQGSPTSEVERGEHRDFKGVANSSRQSTNSDNGQLGAPNQASDYQSNGRRPEIDAQERIDNLQPRTEEWSKEESRREEAPKTQQRIGNEEQSEQLNHSAEDAKLGHAEVEQGTKRADQEQGEGTEELRTLQRGPEARNRCTGLRRVGEPEAEGQKERPQTSEHSLNKGKIGSGGPRQGEVKSELKDVKLEAAAVKSEDRHRVGLQEGKPNVKEEATEDERKRLASVQAKEGLMGHVKPQSTVCSLEEEATEMDAEVAEEGMLQDRQDLKPSAPSPKEGEEEMQDWAEDLITFTDSRKPLYCFDGADRRERDEDRSPLDIVRGMYELAEVVMVLNAFKKQLRLPEISRQDLEQALLNYENGWGPQAALLIEVHARLCKESYENSLDKMRESWQRSLWHRVKLKWRHWFRQNPLDGLEDYKQLDIQNRVLLLHALCHWKVEESSSIQDAVQHLGKDLNNPLMAMLRPDPLGEDDNGHMYWYFGDHCWVYREEVPLWKRERAIVKYSIKKANASKILLVCPEGDFQGDSSGDEEQQTDNGQAEPVGEALKKPTLQEEQEAQELPLSPEGQEKKEDVEEGKQRPSTSSFPAAIGLRKRPKVSYAEDGSSASSSSEKDENKGEEEVRDEGEEDNCAIVEDAPQNGTRTEGHQGTECQDGKEQMGEQQNMDEEEPSPLVCIDCGKLPSSLDSRPPVDCGRDDKGWKCMDCLVKAAQGWPVRRRRSSTISSPPLSMSPAKQPPARGERRSQRIPRRTQPKPPTPVKRPSPRGARRTGRQSYQPQKRRRSGNGPAIGEDDGEGEEEEAKSREELQAEAALEALKKERELVKRRLAQAPPAPPFFAGYGGNTRKWTVVSTSLEELEQLIKDLRGSPDEGDKSWRHSLLVERLGQIYHEQEAAAKVAEKKRRHTFLGALLPARQSARVAVASIRSQLTDEKPLTAQEERKTRSRTAEVTPKGSVVSQRSIRAERRFSRTSEPEETLLPTPSSGIQLLSPSEVLDIGKALTGLDFSYIPAEPLAQDADEVREQREQMIIERLCTDIVERLLREEIAAPFARPVDSELDMCPDYYAVIRHPMDLGTVRTRANAGYYSLSLSLVTAEYARCYHSSPHSSSLLYVKERPIDALIWSNCRLYNQPQSLIVTYADALEMLFNKIEEEIRVKGEWLCLKDRVPLPSLHSLTTETAKLSRAVSLGGVIDVIYLPHFASLRMSAIGSCVPIDVTEPEAASPEPEQVEPLIVEGAESQAPKGGGDYGPNVHTVAETARKRASRGSAPRGRGRGRARVQRRKKDISSEESSAEESSVGESSSASSSSSYHSEDDGEAEGAEDSDSSDGGWSVHKRRKKQALPGGRSRPPPLPTTLPLQNQEPSAPPSAPILHPSSAPVLHRSSSSSSSRTSSSSGSGSSSSGSSSDGSSSSSDESSGSEASIHAYGRS